MGKKLRVGILYGGRSVEHQISVRSAKNVTHYINKDEFDIAIIGIDRLGKWHAMDNVDEDFSKGSPLQLHLDASTPHFVDSTGRNFSVDVVFPVLHGTDGEDGSIQGLLKAMNIPFAGSGVLGSSVAMDKLITKELLFQAGIPVSKYVAFKSSERTLHNFDSVVARVGLPFMVKPANLGSSVGVTKVNDKSQYDEAIATTFLYDDLILIEEYILGRELECAILGNADAKASHPGEIIISDQYEFYTYEAKYEDENAVELVIPANLNSKIIEEIKSLCVKSYHALKCEDFARVDLFLTREDKVYINEINTIPGFTDISMFPALWAQHDISYPELITKIIYLALERDKNTKRINRSFSS